MIDEKKIDKNLFRNLFLDGGHHSLASKTSQRVQPGVDV